MQGEAAAMTKMGIATLVLWLFAVTSIVVRIVLFNNGTLFGTDKALYSNLVMSGFVLAALMCSAGYIAQRGSALPQGSIIAIAGSGVGLVAAVYAFVLIVAPTTPDQAAAPACRGVPVAGAPYFGQTAATGVNAREGAGTGYKQRNRFSGSCTLGFSGYCIGEAIHDRITDIDDTRWFIVYKQNYLVASAEILSQSAEDALGSAPSSDCSKYGGQPVPGKLKFTAKILHPKQATGAKPPPPAASLEVSAQYTSLVGYAVRVLNPIDRSYGYSLIKVKNSAPTFTGVWAAASAVPELAGGSGKVELVASACLAAAAPAGAPAVYLATFKKGVLLSLVASMPQSPDDTGLLQQTACSGQP